LFDTAKMNYFPFWLILYPILTKSKNSSLFLALWKDHSPSSSLELFGIPKRDSLYYVS